jgi:micrococcal nuclease
VTIKPDLWAYILLTLLVMWSLADQIAPYHGAAADCSIGYVIDGDTLEMICEGQTETARLLGFDAPETKSPHCAAEAAWGHRATLRLRDLAKRPNIRLFPQGLDKYRRRLVVMQVGGRDVAGIMIAEGLAVAYDGGHRRDWCSQGALSDF